MFNRAEPPVGMALGKRRMPWVLIVGNKGTDTDQLSAVFNDAGIASECSETVKAACDSARSGRFGVIFTTPESAGESWTRLIEVAYQTRLSFEIVLLARSFDLNQWSEALHLGAYEVMDTLYDLPLAAVIARRALGAGCLMRNRERFEQKSV